MEIKWSYYLIILLYVIIGILKVLSVHEHTRLKKEYPDVSVYKTYKRDFFQTIAIICTVITVCINLAALIGGKGIVGSSIIVTLCIIGMAFLTGYIELLTTDTGTLCLDGTLIEANNIKEVIIKEKKNKTSYEILFVEPISGYESVAFDLRGDKRSTFTNYIKAF